MIICICNWFPVPDRYGLPTGRKELLVDYAVDEDTGQSIVLPNEHPSKLGARFHAVLGEWVL